MNNEVLIESQIARNEQIQKISNEDCIVKLNHVKKIDFNNLHENEVITTQDVAEFYEVVPETIRTLIKTNRDELESDGLKTLAGQGLQDARLILKLPSKSSQATVWTPRAVLRAGMLLRDSEIAKAVRTALLDKVEQKPQSAIDVLEQVFYSFKEHQAKLNEHDNILEQHQETIDTTANELESVKEKLESYRSNPNFQNYKLTINKFCRNKGIEADAGDSRSAGRKLTKLCNVLEIDFDELGNGRSNEYPYWLLEAVLESANDFRMPVEDFIHRCLRCYIED